MKRSAFYEPTGKQAPVGNKTIIKLHELLDFASPESLNQSLRDLLMYHLMKEEELLPEDFQKMVTDVYALMKFLDVATEEMQAANAETIEDASASCKEKKE